MECSEIYCSMYYDRLRVECLFHTVLDDIMIRVCTTILDINTATSTYHSIPEPVSATTTQ